MLRAFLRRPDGSASLEFAFAAPILILAMIGIFELAMLLFTNAVVEGAVRSASRFGLTGQTTTGISREEVIVEKIRDGSLGLVEITTDDIDVLVYPRFADVGRPEPFDDANGNGAFDPGEGFSDVNGNGQWDSDMGAAGAGGPGEVVVYRVRYQRGMMTGLLMDSFGASVDMAASIAVRNEPFDPATGG
ncbi:MAG: pilus assembly protein [Marivibrio sp.]|uniref:TadE/TadG family type IV pilus assembly protein n=1 Tax=Marivibrio sp. TaxID=2039719 RepID=UPI0032EC4A76